MTTSELKRLATPYSPTHDDLFWPFERRINQLINEFFREDSKNSVLASSGNYPIMNAVEENGRYKIMFAVSGMNADDIDVNIKNGMLTVSGRISDEYRSDEKDAKIYRRELRQSAFSRTVQLPENWMI